MSSRNASWTAPSGQTGAGLLLLGPITVSSLFEALNYSDSSLDLGHLSRDTKETIEAAFGWNDSRQPDWLLLDEDIRPFWICNISRHHMHKLGGDHEAAGKGKDTQGPNHAKFHNKAVVDKWYDGTGINFGSSSPTAKTVMVEPTVLKVQRTTRHVELRAAGEDGGAVANQVMKREESSGQTEKLNHLPKWFHLQVKERLLVVGMLSLGTAFGSLLGSDFADYLGRRVTLMIGTALFLVGVADQLASEHLESLMRGRFETGIAVGVITGVIGVFAFFFLIPCVGILPPPLSCFHLTSWMLSWDRMTRLLGTWPSGIKGYTSLWHHAILGHFGITRGVKSSSSVPSVALDLTTLTFSVSHRKQSFFSTLLAEKCRPRLISFS